MDAAAWDERYRASELVWGAPPNVWVRSRLADVTPGRAVDLACGEGRNAVWLAQRGWEVIGVDFSPVAIEKARRLDAHGAVDWQVADATTFAPAQPVDLALLCYLQFAAMERKQAVRSAASALAPGGTLLVIAHDSRNPHDGTGGPQDAAVLYTAADVVGDLDATGLRIVEAGEALRPVQGADRPAIDCLVLATAP